MTNTQELYTRWLSQPDLDDAIKAELVSVAGDNDADMLIAIDALEVPADYALIDGNRDHGASAKITTPHETIVGGDGASLSIAAASVLAKVSRDHYVVEVLDPMYPEYQFARHKGYGTKLHYQMLDQYGPSPVHRMTFLKKWEARR